MDDIIINGIIEDSQEVQGEIHYSTEGVNYADDLSNALKETKSGSIVTIRDVSPIPHNMAVNVSGIEDPMSLSVKVKGKNLIDFFNISTLQNITYTNASGNPATKTGYLLEGLEIGEKYTISFSFKDPKNICMYLYLYNVDENWAQQSITYLTSSTIYTNPYTFTALDGHHYFIIRGASYKITQSEIDKFKEFQLEHGDTKTEYEDYISPITYTPNADGTVPGITSIYPSMTIYTEPISSGAIVECQYNRDINKAFDELKQAIISLGGNV